MIGALVIHNPEPQIWPAGNVCVTDSIAVSMRSVFEECTAFELDWPDNEIVPPPLIRDWAGQEELRETRPSDWRDPDEKGDVVVVVDTYSFGRFFAFELGRFQEHA